MNIVIFIWLILIVIVGGMILSCMVISDMIDRKKGGVKLMKCPKCNGNTKVTDSRCEDDCVNRRRVCLECGYRFSTIEVDRDWYDNMQKRGDS